MNTLSDNIDRMLEVMAANVISLSSAIIDAGGSARIVLDNQNTTALLITLARNNIRVSARYYEPD